ncbi:hypothetical protein [Thalassomonas actiniarum]|uniref:Uncharacterized protein n=1 Tax=Thalassomonas actiniarum TaxID=485447 RepID=A0AAE9YYX7_9GAMM|nr:hypothetical protein [Thalassomonas actiniarum]WDE02093.1 hypothetical protein SG35_030485 [Thalassomonas actiniarum]
MENLDTFIGFSIIMLIVAQISSLLLDIVRYYLGTRNIFYEKFIRELDRELQEVITAHGLNKAQREKLTGLFEKIKDANKPSQELTKEQKRKKRFHLDIKPIPQELVNAAPDIAEPQIFVNSLRNAFEEVDEEFTRDFQVMTAKRTTAIALVVCFVLNINSFHLYEALSNNPELRESLINDQLVTAQNQLYGNGDKLDQVEGSELERLIRLNNQQLDKLQEYDLKIGWIGNYYPKGENLNLYVIVGIIISGLFAGLGAPFWHKVLNRLLGLRQALKGGAGGGSFMELRKGGGNSSEQLQEFTFSAGNGGNFRVFDPVIENAHLTVDVEFQPPEGTYSEEPQIYKYEFHNIIKQHYQKTTGINLKDVTIRSGSYQAITKWFIPE